MAKEELTVFRPSLVATSARGLASTVAFDPAEWEKMKQKVAPMVWMWYEQNKNKKVTKVFGFYQITNGSFGLLAMGLSAIFGGRSSASPEEVYHG